MRARAPLRLAPCRLSLHRPGRAALPLSSPSLCFLEVFTLKILQEGTRPLVTTVPRWAWCRQQGRVGGLWRVEGAGDSQAPRGLAEAANAQVCLYLFFSVLVTFLHLPAGLGPSPARETPCRYPIHKGRALP